MLVSLKLWPRAGMVDSLDLKSSGIYSRGGSSPPEATNQLSKSR